MGGLEGLVCKKTHKHTRTSREVCFACHRCDLVVLLLLLTVQASKPAAQHNAELIMKVPCGASRGRCCPKLLLIFNIRSHHSSLLTVQSSRTSCTEDAVDGGSEEDKPNCGGKDTNVGAPVCWCGEERKSQQVTVCSFKQGSMK